MRTRLLVTPSGALPAKLKARIARVLKRRFSVGINALIITPELHNLRSKIARLNESFSADCSILDRNPGGIVYDSWNGFQEPVDEHSGS